MTIQTDVIAIFARTLKVADHPGELNVAANRRNILAAIEDLDQKLNPNEPVGQAASRATIVQLIVSVSTNISESILWFQDNRKDVEQPFYIPIACHWQNEKDYDPLAEITRSLMLQLADAIAPCDCLRHREVKQKILIHPELRFIVQFGNTRTIVDTF